MLVVCALALVVAAGAFLVIGLAGGDIGDLYLSMALCVASLVVVAASARLARARPPKAAGDPPAPVPPAGDDADADADADRAPAAVPPSLVKAEAGIGPVDLEDDPSASLAERLARVDLAEEARSDEAAPAAVVWAKPEDRSAPEPTPEPEPVVAAEPTVDVTGEAPALDLTAAEGVDFPIADYESLRTEQILPLVPRLWPEEVPVVAERERATKARPAVLDALAEVGHDPELAFPIAEYATLDTDQIVALLEDLEAGDLRTVQAAERSGAARVGVLVAIADALDARRASH